MRLSSGFAGATWALGQLDDHVRRHWGAADIAPAAQAGLGTAVRLLEVLDEASVDTGPDPAVCLTEALTINQSNFCGKRNSISKNSFRKKINIPKDPLPSQRSWLQLTQ